MKILIDRTALMAQLESQEVRGQMPPVVTLDGVFLRPEEEKDLFEKEYPTARKVLTNLEYRVARELFYSRGRMVTMLGLGGVMRGKSDFRSTNEIKVNVRCHIKMIRTKFEKHKIRLTIKTIRGAKDCPTTGGYMMV